MHAAFAALTLSLPAALAAMLAGQFDLHVMLLVWLGSFAGILVLVRPPLASIRELARALDRLATDAPGAVPRMAPPLGDELARALDRLWRRTGLLAARAADVERGATALLDALPDPVLTVSAQRRVVRVNAAARELFGAALPDRDVAEAVRSPAVLAAIDAVLAGSGTREVDLRLTTPVERDFACRIGRLAEPAADGALVYIAFRDFTQVRRSERMRADFVANASHELRTPLATLTACVETLADLARDDPEARDRFLGLMQQQAQRMTRLVEDLLSLSRIELREHFAPTDPVALDDLLARAVRGLEMKAREAGVSLELKPVGGLPRLIGDADELEQVLQNLIDNAIKYGADGGRIEIGAAPSERGLPGRKGRAVRVWVRDWGPGIEPEHLPRLTERFYRVDTARSRALGGTGLGMAIVKHIVNRHRGQLTIESAPGEGSTFIVLLPAA